MLEKLEKTKERYDKIAKKYKKVEEEYTEIKTKYEAIKEEYLSQLKELEMDVKKDEISTAGEPNSKEDNVEIHRYWVNPIFPYDQIEIWKDIYRGIYPPKYHRERWVPPPKWVPPITPYCIQTTNNTSDPNVHIVY